MVVIVADVVVLAALPKGGLELAAVGLVPDGKLDDVCVCLMSNVGVVNVAFGPNDKLEPTDVIDLVVAVDDSFDVLDVKASDESAPSDGCVDSGVEGVGVFENKVDEFVICEDNA